MTGMQISGSASVDRRASEMERTEPTQSFRIRKYSRSNRSLSQRSNSLSENGHKDELEMNPNMQLTDLKKTIDSEDEDGIVMRRDRSQTANQNEQKQL